jgi:hypothetical protein
MTNETNEKIEMIDVPMTDIGEDKPAITAKRIVIEDVKLIKDIKKKDGTIIGDKIVCLCRHPDNKELLSLSKVKYEKDGKIESSALWYRTDSDGKIPYKSALACLLRFKGKKQIKDLKGEQMETALDDEGYLILKGY